MASSETLTEEIQRPRTVGKPTLLIVDDEAGPRESLRIVFKDRYHCAVATCGREGIDYARAHAVDAAILDIKMPDVSGVEVLREIKKIDASTECIMLTGYETIETARAAVRFGAADYLNKPFDVFSIRELLEKCMARRQQKLATEDTLQRLKTMNDDLGRELAQSERAVAAGLLSAGVVHEMNSPLSIIAGYTQLLERDLLGLQTGNYTAAQAIQQRLGSIQREIERCKDIAKRFLNFSRARHSQPEQVVVSLLLEDAVSLIRAHPANHGVEISRNISDPTLQLRVYPSEILQVLLNLAANALQAMDGKGTLILAAAPATPPANCQFRSNSLNPQQAFVKLSVIDSGCGISAENLQKIFQPYFTTKKEGTGLGLAIVCELVNQSGGLIHVQSEPGHGSTFSVYLPVAA